MCEDNFEDDRTEEDVPLDPEEIYLAREERYAHMEKEHQGFGPFKDTNEMLDYLEEHGPFDFDTL